VPKLYLNGTVFWFVGMERVRRFRVTSHLSSGPMGSIFSSETLGSHCSYRHENLKSDLMRSVFSVLQDELFFF
jgi:hypothetical protein